MISLLLAFNTLFNFQVTIDDWKSSIFAYLSVWQLVRVLIYSKLEINFFTLGKKLVGTSGLEPPTSRLSGVRSNHLSYAPVISLSKPLAFKLISCEIFVNKNSPDPSPAFGFSVFLVSPWCSHFFRSDGGDEEDRTPDPLLAKQVLSQLSYTPIQGIRFHLMTFSSSIQEPEN